MLENVLTLYMVFLAFNRLLLQITVLTSLDPLPI